MEVEYKGRLTYAKGTSVEFVVGPNQDVDFGDILVVEGKNNDRFYIRAYDFKVKSRWSGLNGVGYLMSKLDENGQVENQEDLDFYLGGNHTVKIGMAEQLCYADEKGQLLNPKTCPDFFCQVRTLSPQDTSMFAEMKGDLEIGFLKSGRGALSLPVGIYGSQAITEHIGVFGTTGSGKSNLIKVLASSVIDSKNYGLLIFDVHNEYYKDLSAHPMSKERLCVYHTQDGDYGKRIGVNFTEVDADDIIACATFTEPQLDAIYKMSTVWQENWMRYVIQYDVADIIEELAGCTGQKFHARTIGKIKSICWNLVQELNIDEEEQAAVGEMLKELEDGKVVLVELKNISQVGERALSTLLSKKLLKNYAGKSQEERSQIKPVLTVLEEAHRFLGKKENSGTNVFSQLVSEARKFNLGMCIVDQQPRLLANNVLSQLNTLFILGLASKADRTKLEAMCRKDILSQRNEIKNLECGEMIVATNYMRFAAPVKVHKFENFLQQRYGNDMSITPVV